MSFELPSRHASWQASIPTNCSVSKTSISFPDRETFDRAFASPEWKHALADAGNYITDHQRLLFETTVQRLEEPN